MKPITILVRVGDPSPHWEEWSSHSTVEQAEWEYHTRIDGRGITAWTGIGPSSLVNRMLAEPDWAPPESWPKGCISERGK